MRRNSTRLLVVGSNDASRTSKACLLRGAGWMVEEAVSGEEALELVASNPIGLVVLETALAGIDGFETCRIIKQRHSDVLIVQTSATFRESRDRVLALDMGADAYLVEPAEDAELIAIVRSLLRLRLAEAGLRDSEERFRLAAEAGGVGIYDTDIEKGIMRISQELATILGLPSATEISVQRGMAFVDPRDREALISRAAGATDASGDSVLAMDLRVVRADGALRWVSVRGRTHYCEIAGERKAVRSIGAVLDITERKQWEETQRLLLSELNHRIKNTLTTVQAIASQTLRTTSDPEEFATSLNGRLQALAKAHALLTQSSWEGAYLDDIMDNQFADAEPGKIFQSGPRVFLPPRLALPVALTLHELATNARKYGALSTPEGRLKLNWSVKESPEKVLDFYWMEIGGPPVTEPTRVGFGSKLIQQSLSGLGGEVDLIFSRAGVRCRIRLPVRA